MKEQESNVTTPQRIMNAAITCINRWGVDKTSLNDIARDAGVSRKTLYMHFENREQLLVAAIAHHIELIITDVINHIKGFDSPQEKLVEAIIFCVKVLTKDTYMKLIKDSSFSSSILDNTFTYSYSLIAHNRVISEVVREHSALERNIDVISEVGVRLVISLLTVKSPSERSEDQLRERLRFWLYPMLDAADQTAD